MFKFKIQKRAFYSSICAIFSLLFYSTNLINSCQLNDPDLVNKAHTPGTAIVRWGKGENSNLIASVGQKDLFSNDYEKTNSNEIK